MPQRYSQSWGESVPNKALHRTAICAWGFAVEFLAFISQDVAVGELHRSAAQFPTGNGGV